MSVAILSDKHYQVLGVYAALHTGTDPVMVANEIRRANVAAYNYRYAENHGAVKNSKVKFVEGDILSDFSHADIETAASCAMYQCEGEASEKSAGFLFTLLIERIANGFNVSERKESKIWFI